MQITVELPDHVVAELIREHDDAETAVELAVLLCHEMDTPPEVREHVQQKYELDASSLRTKARS